MTNSAFGRIRIGAAFAAAFLAATAIAPAADSGPRGDVAAIRKLLTHAGGRCPMSVPTVATNGNFALATVEERGVCDIASVTVLKRAAGTWRSLGGIGGVADACTVHAKGVPLAVSATLVRRFTGSSDPSLVSTTHCKP